MFKCRIGNQHVAKNGGMRVINKRRRGVHELEIKEEWGVRVGSQVSGGTGVL